MTGSPGGDGVQERVREEAARAAACLLAGGVVLLPTDTVYGLAVHPERDEAITRLFAMKGRPRSVNLPVMISSRDDITALGGVVTTAAELLLEAAGQFVVVGCDPNLSPRRRLDRQSAYGFSKGPEAVHRASE